MMLPVAEQLFYFDACSLFKARVTWLLQAHRDPDVGDFYRASDCPADAGWESSGPRDYRADILPMVALLHRRRDGSRAMWGSSPSRTSPCLRQRNDRVLLVVPVNRVVVSVFMDDVQTPKPDGARRTP